MPVPVPVHIPVRVPVPVLVPVKVPVKPKEVIPKVQGPGLFLRRPTF